MSLPITEGHQMTNPTDDELDARNRKAAQFMEELHKQVCEEQGDHPDECDTAYSLASYALAAITALRAQLAEVQAERDNANKIMDDWTTLHRVIADIRDASGLGSRPMLSELASKIGKRIADANARADTNEALYVKALGRSNEQEDRADRAEAALAAQIEADAGIVIAMKGNGWDENPAIHPYDKGYIAACDTAISRICLQPHDRTALDRMLWAERETVLRKAGSVAQETSDEIDEPQDVVQAILAMIEQPKETK